MKNHILLFSALLFPCAGHAASTVHAFWSVQTDAAGGTADGDVTAENFNGTPSITRTGSARTSDGGATDFTAWDGSFWEGSGTLNNPGKSFGWNVSTGNSLTISLNMADTYDLLLRADFRSAQNTGIRPTAFTAIEYSVDGGGFVSAGVPLAFGIPASNGFEEYTLDLSGLSAIEDEEDVQIRFSIPDVLTGTSFRMDNIQLQATLVPEPSALVMALGAGFLALRRRR